jgi:alpha-glucosidase
MTRTDLTAIWTEPWWRRAAIYQIYVRSFVDSNGDGIGDLPGITSRLEYLRWLGVDALWLTPINASPNKDWGYDVSDYEAVHPELGTLSDFDELVAEAHRRDLRILLDLVPNHTSSEHAWFRDARSSFDAAHRAFYVWADPAPDGGPPNNWVSLFGGPAWTLEPSTGQYYLHSFLASQPDLNWWNEDVRDAFDGILRFWFDRGIDGFRIDVAAGMVKDRSLRNNPPAIEDDHDTVRALGQRQEFNMDRPEVHDVLRRWRALTDRYDHDRVLLGEAYVLDLERLAAYYGNGRDELHLAFNFLLLHSDLDAEQLRDILGHGNALDRIDAWPAWAGSNHDAGRLATRWARGDPARTRCALMLLLTLRGTPVLYYGDELGLTDVAVPPDRAVDPGRSANQRPGRDGARTPMPWNGAPNGGFTAATARPWLPLGDLRAGNVADQEDDPRSVLHLCRDLLALRRRHPDLSTGALKLLDSPPHTVALRRGERFLVALNLGERPATVAAPAGRVVLSSGRDGDYALNDGQLTLDRWEGVLVDTYPQPERTA